MEKVKQTMTRHRHRGNHLSQAQKSLKLRVNLSCRCNKWQSNRLEIASGGQWSQPCLFYEAHK